MRTAVAAVLGLSLLVPAPALAHHSFAMFDTSKEVVLAGSVKEFQWTNPHTWIQLTVRNAKGQTEEWSIEGSSPNRLGRVGWNRASFKPGDKVTLRINPLKSGDKGGSFKSATFADGHTLGTDAPGAR